MYKFLCALVMYIVIVSSLLTYAVFEMENTRIEGVNIPSAFFTDSISFGNSSKLDDVFAGKLTASLYYTITNNTLVFYNSYPIRFEDIYIKGIQPESGGEYKVSYTIINTDNSRFRFWIYQTGISNIGSVYVQFNENTIDLIESGGLYLLWDKTLISTSYPNPTTGTVTTILNPVSGLIQVLIDDILYLSYIHPTPQTINHYGGIGVMGNTFEVQGVETPILIQTEETPSIFEIIGSLLLWNVSEDYIPFWLNIVMIKVPIIFLALAIAFYIRGVS